MAFNADEHAAALIPPILVVDGVEYRGRLLSVEEVAALFGSRGEPGDIAATRAFMRRCVETWFPAPPVPWWRRVLGRLVGRRPVNPVWRAFARLPDATQLAAIESFSVAQKLASGAFLGGPAEVDRTTSDVPRPSAG